MKPVEKDNLTRLICTHNPFYLISVCLVLYGLQLSFERGATVSNCWLLMKLFCSYTFLLAVAGVLIIRVGKVWEDGRTVLLLIAFLITALSVCFDRVCLDDTRTGIRLLVFGFAFAIILTETILRTLHIRLPIWYRAPLYVQWAFLFAVPVWLGQLSIQGHNRAMNWTVLGFPAAGAVSLLLLLPACHLGRALDQPNGTPWSWPWFPWPLFVFQIVGLSFRSYGISVSFELSQGFGAAFQPYFLIPLLFATLILFCELTETTKRHKAAAILRLLPLALLVFAFPSIQANAAQAKSVDLLLQTIGSPAWITVVLLVVYYVFCAMRQNRFWELGLVSSLMLMAFVGRTTVRLDALSLSWQPLVVILIWMTMSAVWKRDSSRATIAFGMGGILIQHIFKQHSMPMETSLVVYATFFFWLTTGLYCRDRVAEVVRWIAPTLLLISNFALVLDVIVDGRFLGLFPISFAVMILMLCCGYWLQIKSLTCLYIVFANCISVAAMATTMACFWINQHLFLKGKEWILWGLVVLIAATCISFWKAGWIVRLRIFLRKLNRRFHGREPESVWT